MTLAEEQLRGLADYLQAARTRILQRWQDAVAEDPQLTTALTISRTQFNDHIPQVLEAYERRLRAHNPSEKRQAREEQRENAAEHGLHRWQQGYDQRETMREWGHLHLCVLAELERFAREHHDLDTSAMPVARAALVQLCADGVCESAARYARLHQSEAASRVRDLEQGLKDLQELERERAAVLREAAHDLRGTVGVITGASTLLARENASEQSRMHLSQVLRRNVSSLQELLGELMDLARLEAGQEQRKIASFDAAQLLREFCDAMQNVATERGLFLKTEGPACLPVEGDALKIRRIAQNLVLNALKVTKRGGVLVTWEKHEIPGTQQWILCVQDTGPGFDPVHAAPLARVLKEATMSAQDVEASAALSGEAIVSADPAPMLASRSSPASSPLPAGEGIGLSIVKRLCELLDASVELQTTAGSGTTFRVVLPRRYENTAIVEASV